MQNRFKNFYRSVRNFTYRSQLELVISFVLAFIILLAEYGGRIIQKLDTSDGSEPILRQTATEFISLKLSELSTVPHANTAVLALFWTGAAILLYISFLVLSNIFITFKNELTLDSQDYNRKRHYLIRRVITKILVLIVFYVLVAVSVKVLIPHWINLAGLFVDTGLALNTLHYFVLGLIGLSWNIYLIWVLGKLVFSYEKTL